MFQDSGMASLIPGRPTPLGVWSDESFLQARTWIAECESGHIDCTRDVEHRLPTRVVDVGDSARQPSLLESNGRYGKWVALSYCWGKKHPLKTELSTLSAFRRRLPPTLPLLFQDAILTVKNLGYQYLWIDSLCIVQDSYDDEDWLTESTDMGRIFKEAALVIIAEAATDAWAGLFNRANEGKRNARITVPSFSTEHDTHGDVMLVPALEISELSKGPLSSRAWALQEEVLSSRNLRFASDRIWWQYWSLQRDEAFPHGAHSAFYPWDEWHRQRRFKLTTTPRRLGSISQAQQDHDFHPNLCWYRTVNDYCRRGIAFEKDLLPAISGVAKEYAKHLKQEYNAGLWRGDMHLGLLWCSPCPNAMKTRDYVAPSWSWATLRLPPRLPAYELRDVYLPIFNYLQPKNLIATIRSVSVMPLHQDIFGQIRTGVLEISAPCYKICRCNIPSSFFDCHQPNEPNISRIYDMLLETRSRSGFAGETALRESCTMERIMERECRQGTDVIHQGCVLLHIASGEMNRLAFSLILETVPPEETGEFRHDQVSSVLEHMKRPQTKSRTRAFMDSGIAKGGDVELDARESEQGSAQADERLPTYRRIGLSHLKETIPTSDIWPTRTVTII